MTIDLQGYGYFEIEEKGFPRFVEITGMDNDLFLDIMNMQKNFSVIPIISINAEVIEKEGPLAFGHQPTKIGTTRIKRLLQEGIIEEKS